MPAVWERAQDQAPTSYVKEMLTSQASLNGLLGSMALGTLLAFPYGFGVATIPVLFFAAAEAVAALFVPNSPSFRSKIDRDKRKERRERARSHLVEALSERTVDDPLWSLYDSMLTRLDSLRHMVGTRNTTLSESDIERLDDATVDFLSLWLGRLAMTDRLEAIDEAAVRSKLKSIARQIDESSDSSNRRQLQQAKSDLERILTRRERLLARQAAVEAAQLSLADIFDEVYQGVMTNSTTGENSRDLQEAVERLHIEEDLDIGGDDAFSAEGIDFERTEEARNHPDRPTTNLRLRSRKPDYQ